MRRRLNVASVLHDLQRTGGGALTIPTVVPRAGTPTSDVGSVISPLIQSWAVGAEAIAPGAVGAIAIAAGALDITKFASTIRPVAIVGALPGLPDTNYPDGACVILTTDHKLYRNNAGTWVKNTAGTDIDADSITAGQIAAGAIGAREIAAGAVSTAKLAVVAPGAALNADSSCSDSAAWNASGASVVTITDGKVGNTVLRSATGAYNGALQDVKQIPVDPNKVYRVHVWVRRTSAADGIFYALLGLRDSSGVDISGDGSYWYYWASGVTPVANTWTEYVGTFGPGTTKGAIPSNARTMFVGALLNYSAPTGGYYEIQDIRIEEVAPATLIADGAIITSKLAVNAVTAAKVLAGEITTSKLNIVSVMVDGATWTDNSPSGGSVAWSGASVYYKGVTYAITNSNTASKYIWWDKNSSNTTFQSSNTRPTLGDDAFMIATNNAGAHDLAWNAPATAGVFPTHLSFEAMASLFIFGDGTDGVVTLSSNTTLSRDMMYDSLTINNGVTLDTNGYRVFVKNTFTNNGTVKHNGGNGGNGTHGTRGSGSP